MSGKTGFREYMLSLSAICHTIISGTYILRLLPLYQTNKNNKLSYFVGNTA